MLSPEHLRTDDRPGLGRRVWVGTAAAAVGVSACFFVASLTGGALMVAVRDTGATSVPFGAAVMATAAAGGGAYLLARLAGRTARPRRIFLMLTTAGLLVSALPPLTAATTVSTAIWLLVMHAAAALALVPLVASGLPSGRPVGGSEVAAPARTLVAGSTPVDSHQ